MKIDMDKIIQNESCELGFTSFIEKQPMLSNSSEMIFWLDSLDKSEFRRVMSFLKDISQRKGV